MKLSGALVLGLAALWSQVAAAQNDAWICSWPGYNADHQSVIARFHVEGDALIEDSFKLPYHILQNTPYAIVAAWSIAHVEPNRTTPSIGAFVVIIDKTTLVFRRSNVILTEPGESTSYGKCING